MIDVVALGRTGWPVRRDGAEPGDHVWVTGSLGASAAAVEAWNAGEEPSESLRSAFVRPVARVQEARCLVEQEVVDAMIDVSDGLDRRRGSHRRGLGCEGHARAVTDPGG